MNIHPITVRTFEITDAPGLDSIRVYLQDLAPGQGRITLECYGCAWACYFGSMGEGKGIGDFVRTAGSDYITNALAVARGARGVARQKAYLRCIVDAVQAALNVQADECASRDSNPPTPPPSTRMLPIISFTTSDGSDVITVVQSVTCTRDTMEIRVFEPGDSESYYTATEEITMDALRQAMTSSLQTSSVVQVTRAGLSPEMTPAEFMTLAQDLFSRPTCWTQDAAWIMNTLRGLAYIRPGGCLPTAVAEYMRLVCAPVSSSPSQRGPAPMILAP